MRKVLMIILAASLCAGCAIPKKRETGSFVQRYSESRRLEQAVEMLEEGDSPGAVELLKAISNASPAPGVTDEALFRLALLSLKPSAERPAAGQGRQLLKRLRKEYPESPWTAQAAPLSELFDATEELRQLYRNQKAANRSLTREVSELKKNIEQLDKNLEQLNSNLRQLKRLDLELEQKVNPPASPP